MHRILFVFLLFIASSQTRAESRLLDALTALQFKSGEFIQTVRNGEGQVLEASDGVFDFGNNGAFRWEYLSGSEQIIVADGESVWMIDPGLEQVIIKSQQSTIGRRPADVLLQPEALYELFSVDEVAVGNGFSAELQPKESANAGYEWIKITGSNSKVTRLEVQDALGNRTEILFKNIREAKPSMELFAPTFDDRYDLVDER